MGGFTYFPPSKLTNCLGGFSFVGGSAGGSLSFDFTTGSLPGGIVFIRASIGTYLNNVGVLITATADTPRFNYVAGVANLLIEPAATNILLFSNAFTSGGWSVENAAVLTAAQFISPDGTNNGWSDTSGSGFGQAVQQVTLSAGPYTCSTWIKQISGGGSGWLALGGQFSSGLSISSTIARKTFTSTPGVGSQKFGLNGGNGAGVTLGVFGAQIETGTVATSYIVTGASTVTRAADAATFTIPAGTGHLTYTFDDNSTQLVTVSAGSYTIPTNLNRPNIKSIVGSA